MAIDHKCEMCVMLDRVFPGRFNGCADLSHKMAFNMVKEMIAKMASLSKEVDDKFKAGEISKDERDNIIEFCERSVAFCAATVPGAALFLRVKTNPIEMMELVAKEAARVVALVLGKSNKINDLLSSIMPAQESPPIDPSKLN